MNLFELALLVPASQLHAKHTLWEQGLRRITPQHNKTSYMRCAQNALAFVKAHLFKQTFQLGMHARYKQAWKQMDGIAQGSQTSAAFIKQIKQYKCADIVEHAFGKLIEKPVLDAKRVMNSIRFFSPAIVAKFSKHLQFDDPMTSDHRFDGFE